MNQPDPAEIETLRATVEIACARSERYDYPRTTTDTGTGYVMVDAFFLQSLLAALATAEERADKAEATIAQFECVAEEHANYHKATGPQAETES